MVKIEGTVIPRGGHPIGWYTGYLSGADLRGERRERALLPPTADPKFKKKKLIIIIIKQKQNKPKENKRKKNLQYVCLSLIVPDVDSNVGLQIGH